MAEGPHLDSLARSGRGRRLHGVVPPVPRALGQRALSSPALERTQLPLSARSGYGGLSARSGRGVGTTSCSPLPSTRPSTASSAGRRTRPPCSPAGTLPERSEKSVERYRDDCLRLKSEVADRREESKQLQQRVRLLEGSLQVRMNQLEILAEELRSITNASFCSAEGSTVCASCGRGDRRLPELLDRLITEARRTQVVLHSHADTGAHLEAKERLLEQDRAHQVHLEDQLHESRLQSRRLAAKVRDNPGEHGGLKQRLDEVRRAARKQDELLAAYEQSHQELSERMQFVAVQLDEERRGRREQELTAQKLAIELEEARHQLSQAAFPEAEAPATGRAAASDAASCQTEQEEEGYSSALTLRLEHERLRHEEREQRRRRRGTQPQADGVHEAPSFPSAPPRLPPRPQQDAAGGAGSSGSAEAAKMLARALSEVEASRAAEAEAQESERTIREERQACHRELEVARFELRLEVEAQNQFHELSAQAESAEVQYSVLAAERRATMFAEVANEVAYQADLRQLQTLHDEVEMQRAVGAAELRCSMLAAIVNQAAAEATSSTATAACASSLPRSAE